jgi:hypothetical protein
VEANVFFENDHQDVADDLLEVAKKVHVIAVETLANDHD